MAQVTIYRVWQADEPACTYLRDFPPDPMVPWERNMRGTPVTIEDVTMDAYRGRSRAT